MNKLSFSVDKLPLQEACCRPCFCPRVYTTGFLQLTFNSQVSIPDKGFRRGPTKQANANKKSPLFPVQQSAVEIMLYLELLCLSIKNEMLKFGETD